MQAGSVPVRRRGRIVPAAVALLVGSWLLAAAPAAAHALVVGSNPQAGARIARAPAELRVAFSEAVRPLGPGLTLQGPSGGQVRLGPVRHPDGRPEVLAATLPTLGDGSYLAGWRIVSADDGHLEAGSFAFAVGTGSGPVTSPAPSQLPTPWQVAGRWLETAGVLGLVGVVVAALAIWHRPEPIGPDEPRWWALTVAAAAVGAVGLAWQVAAGAATVGGLGPGAVGAFLSASPATGRRLLVELVLLGATAALVWWRVRNGRRPGLGALALAAGAVVTLALGAHDTGLAPRWLFLPLEVVHLLAVGAWIGGLVVLALTARRAKLEAVRRFSVLALRAVLVVAVTGIWQGLAQVSSRAALTGTDYGRVLAVKAAGFLAVLSLAAVARFRLLPRASADAVAGETPGRPRRARQRPRHPGRSSHLPGGHRCVRAAGRLAGRGRRARRRTRPGRQVCHRRRPRHQRHPTTRPARRPRARRPRRQRPGRPDRDGRRQCAGGARARRARHPTGGRTPAPAGPRPGRPPAGRAGPALRGRLRRGLPHHPCRRATGGGGGAAQQGHGPLRPAVAACPPGAWAAARRRPGAGRLPVIPHPRGPRRRARHRLPHRLRPGRAQPVPLPYRKPGQQRRRRLDRQRPLDPRRRRPMEARAHPRLGDPLPGPQLERSGGQRRRSWPGQLARCPG